MSYIRIKPGYYSSSPYWEEEKLKKRIEMRQRIQNEQAGLKAHAERLKLQAAQKKVEIETKQAVQEENQ